MLARFNSLVHAYRLVRLASATFNPPLTGSTVTTYMATSRGQVDVAKGTVSEFASGTHFGVARVLSGLALGRA